MLIQLSEGTAFIRGLTLEKAVEGSSTPGVRASWELRYPNCITTVCVEFTQQQPSRTVRTCLERNKIASLGEIVETNFPCNVNVTAILKAGDGGAEVKSSTTTVVYTGGMRKS